MQEIYRQCECGSGKKFKFCCAKEFRWVSKDGKHGVNFGPVSCVGSNHAVIEADTWADAKGGVIFPAEDPDFLIKEFGDRLPHLADAIESSRHGDYSVGVCVRCVRVLRLVCSEVCASCLAPKRESATTVPCSSCGDVFSTYDETWEEVLPSGAAVEA